jgi:hypothetical protein
MKSLPLIMILCIFLTAFSCSQNNTVQPQTADHLAKYRDTIVGNFSGSQIDTLISEPLDSISDPNYKGFHYHWRVFAKNGSVDDILIDNTIAIKFVKEGDLDGDGADEWGYKTEWETSTWMLYHVYTYKNGKPHLIEPSPIWDIHLDPANNDRVSISQDEIVSKYSHDSVKLKFSDVRNDGEDFLLIDTIMPILR